MKQPSIKKNYIYKLLFEMLAAVTPLITAPYIARVLGPDGVGVYSYSLSNMTYFTLFAALGTISYGTREIAQHRNNAEEYTKIFWEIEVLTLLTTTASLLVWGVVIYFSQEYKIYYIVLIPQLLAVAADISWFFTGLERISYTVVINSVCKILGIVSIFLFVKEKTDLYKYILIVCGTHFVGNLSMWAFLPKYLCRISHHSLSLRKHFKETLIYFIPAAATSVYTVLDKTLIGLITKNEFQNGYYEQATKIVTICKTVAFTAVNSVMRARMSFLFAEKRYEEIQRRLNDAMSYILFLGFGCVGGLLAISENLVPWFFGPGYEEVVPLMCFMCPLIVIIGVSNCLGAQYFTPSGQRKKSAKVVVIGAFINLCCNLLFIPKLLSVGAIIGSIVAELVITFLYVKMCGDYMTWQQLWTLSYKKVIAATIMFFAVKLVGTGSRMDYVLKIPLQIVSGVVVYFTLLLLMKDPLVKGTFVKVFCKRNGKSVSK